MLSEDVCVRSMYVYVCVQHIWALENEREARGQEATEAGQRHAQALEQVKLRDMAAADLQKKVNLLLR